MRLKSRRPYNQGFTLVELIVVFAILSLLLAVLFPTFLTARGKAREMVCIFNLRQIGVAISLYNQDNDGKYPYAIDAADKNLPQLWDDFPEFQAQIPKLKQLHEVLQPYVQEKKIFRCPSDTGYVVEDLSGLPLSAAPSSFEQFGSSYGYHTAVAVKQANEPSLKVPSQFCLLLDGAGSWHGTIFPLERRYNVLFADGHVKSLKRPKMISLWKSEF